MSRYNNHFVHIPFPIHDLSRMSKADACKAIASPIYIPHLTIKHGYHEGEIQVGIPMEIIEAMGKGPALIFIAAANLKAEIEYEPADEFDNFTPYLVKALWMIIYDRLKMIQPVVFHIEHDKDWIVATGMVRR